MIAEKAYPICILEILKEYSDSDHILSMKEIIEKMNLHYGVRPDRRTVYSSIALLNDLGYDISIYEENKRGYYLKSRQLEHSEVLLLMNAVYSFPIIPAKQSEELIKKLQRQLSVYQRKEYRHLTIVRKDKKTHNQQVFWNIEILDEAISEKRKVSFTYLKYKNDKVLHPTRERPYVVNPYEMIIMNERYYLICKMDKYDDIAFYRIDRMKDIKILEEKSVGKENYKEYVTDAMYAFSGKPEKIKILFEDWVLSEIIDRFGTDITIQRMDDKKSIATFFVPPKGVKFWALQYLTYVEVLEPEWLRKEIIKSLKSNPYIKSEE